MLASKIPNASGCGICPHSTMLADFMPTAFSVFSVRLKLSLSRLRRRLRNLRHFFCQTVNSVGYIDASYNSIFLLYTLKDRIMTDYSSIASGTTFAELKIFALKQCRVFDAPLAMQNEFAAFVEQVNKQKLTIQQSLDKLEVMKKALMQEYFG